MDNRSIKLSVAEEFSWVVGIDGWYKQTAKALIAAAIALFACLSLASCGDRAVTQTIFSKANSPAQLSGEIAEVSPPEVIQQLRQNLENYQPQVKVLSPQADEIFQDDPVTVKLQVQDLPVFKNQELEMGPHLHVILDNQPYIAVYDLDQPLVFSDLPPGTHTLRVFASRPWHESFKNEGAYAQTTFHVFTKTEDNNPNPALPLLTYSRPKGSYGAEPILLDFYLTNAPLHLVAQESQEDEIADWRIRCTINGNSFVLNRWEPVYLQGFKPGKNWVQLEFLDEQGNTVKNVFNNTARVITYEPKGKDTLSKLVRGELSAEAARGIVDPNYTAKIPEATPTSTPTPSQTPLLVPTPTPSPTPFAPTPEPSIAPLPEIVPEIETEDQTAESQVDTEEPEAMESEVETEEPAVKIPDTQKPSRFFQRFRRRESVTPAPNLPPVPEIIETPASESAVPETTPQPESTTAPNPSVSPTLTPEIITPAENPNEEQPSNINLEPEEPEPKLDIKEILTP